MHTTNYVLFSRAVHQQATVHVWKDIKLRYTTDFTTILLNSSLEENAIINKNLAFNI